MVFLVRDGKTSDDLDRWLCNREECFTNYRVGELVKASRVGGVISFDQKDG